MNGGWYCRKCGACVSVLPTGVVTCQACGAMGLNGFEGARPKQVKCKVKGCTKLYWRDGVDPMSYQHRLFKHEAAESVSPKEQTP